MTSPNTWTFIAALLMAIGVGLGAFGAHGLKGKVPPGDLDIWQTAVFYHLIHALALLILSQISLPKTWPLSLMLFGILIFSGTLYALVLSNTRWLGAITPIGGSALIISWLAIAVFSWLRR